MPMKKILDALTRIEGKTPASIPYSGKKLLNESEKTDGSIGVIKFKPSIEKIGLSIAKLEEQYGIIEVSQNKHPRVANQEIYKKLVLDAPKEMKVLGEDRFYELYFIKSDIVHGTNLLSENIDRNDANLQHLFNTFGSMSTGNEVSEGNNVYLVELMAIESNIKSATIEFTKTTMKVGQVSSDHIYFTDGTVYPKTPIYQSKMWRQVLIFSEEEDMNKCLTAMNLFLPELGNWKIQIRAMSQESNFNESKTMKKHKLVLEGWVQENPKSQERTRRDNEGKRVKTPDGLGVIKSEIKIPTFSQMVPFQHMIYVTLDSGKTSSYRKDLVKLVKDAAVAEDDDTEMSDNGGRYQSRDPRDEDEDYPPMMQKGEVYPESNFNESKTMKKHKLVLEGQSLVKLLRQFPKEVTKFNMGGDLDEHLYHALYDYYFDDMPYGTKKARDGDPYEWISDRLEKELKDYIESDYIESDEELTELSQAQITRARNLRNDNVKNIGDRESHVKLNKFRDLEAARRAKLGKPTIPGLATNESKTMKKHKLVLEGQSFRVASPSLAKLLRHFPKEVTDFNMGGDLDDHLYNALYDYYFDDMPYGTKKARDGDPYVWISDRLEQDLNSDIKSEHDFTPATASMEGAAGDIMPMEEETEDWYDKNGRLAPNGSYDVGGHYFADRDADHEYGDNDWNDKMVEDFDDDWNDEWDDDWKDKMDEDVFDDFDDKWGDDDDDLDEDYNEEWGDDEEQLGEGFDSAENEELITDILTDIGMDNGLDYFFDGGLVAIGRSTAKVIINALKNDPRISGTPAIQSMDGEEVQITFDKQASMSAPELKVDDIPASDEFDSSEDELAMAESVNEDVSMNIMANGEDDVLNVIRKLSGLGKDETAVQVEPEIEVIPQPESGPSMMDLMSVMTPGNDSEEDHGVEFTSPEDDNQIDVVGSTENMGELDEEEVEYDNSPEEVILPGYGTAKGDKDRQGSMYAATAGGSNPMAESLKLMTQYRNMLATVKK